MPDRPAINRTKRVSSCITAPTRHAQPKPKNCKKHLVGRQDDVLENGVIEKQALGGKLPQHIL